MNLSSIAGTLGAAFGGYADDEKERLRQQQIALANQTGEDERLTKLRMAGFLPAPLGGTQVPNAPNLPSLPGVSAMPSQGGQAGAGIVPRAMGPSLDRFLGGDTPGQAILDKMMQNPGNQGTTPPLTIRTSKGPQSFEFDYDSSPQGIMEKRQAAVQTLRDKDAADRAQANERLKAQDALTEKQRQQTEREKIIQDRIAALAPVYPKATPQQLRGTAENDAAFAAAVKPDAVQKETWTAVGTPDADGNMVEHSSSGGFRTTNIKAGAKPGQQGGMSGQGQNMQARLLGAVSEGRLAIQRMNEFEKNHTREDGSLDVNSFDQMRGNAAGLDPHNILNIAAQGLAEGSANKDMPEYQQYLRDAKMIARAEQLMSARGGSEAMAHANELLSRGGANAPKATLDAAKKSRNALFGELGAVVQTLTPGQLEKLDKGLSALRAGDEDKTDFSALGHDIFKGGGNAAPATDPKNAQRSALWKKLVMGGMDKEQAKATALRQIP